MEIPEPGRARLERASPTVLELRTGKRALGRISGDRRRLDLIGRLLGDKVDERVLDTILPKDADAFEWRVEERRTLVSGLLAEGRDLVEQVERLVCAIYDVPPDLTDEVVAHAVRRSS